MSDLIEALNRILNWLQQNHPSDVELLEPGLSKAEMEEIIEDLPLQLPQDIQELYQWKNGSKIIGEYENFCCAFESWSFYSLEIVINAFFHNREFMPILERDNYSRLNIFFSPELTDTGYATVDETKQQTSPIIFMHCKAGANTPIIKYASLTKMMQTVAECYEQAYYVNVDGYLIADEVKRLEFWRKHNSEYIAKAALEKLNGELSLERLFDVEADLIQAEHPMAVEPLLKILEQPVAENNLSVHSVHILAIKVLGILADDRATNPLIQFLNNKNFLIRTAAVRALGEIKAVRALQPLRQLIQYEDEDDYVKEVAFIVMEKIEQSR